MKSLAMLASSRGHRTMIAGDLPTPFADLAAKGECDVCIVSAEDGFSPLGVALDFFSGDLVIPVDEIKHLARNVIESDHVALAAIASKNRKGRLKGVILAPGETAKCYRPPAALSLCGRPYRDFYYNVSYEAIALACREWGARKLAISHLSASNRYHEDIATCHAEALAHFCDGHEVMAPDSFVFCGCCIAEDHLQGIGRLNADAATSFHRAISVSAESSGVGKILCISW